MSILATAVFVPGSFPKHTYVERAQGLEGLLRDAVNTPGMVVSLVGPSKSGKTVLVEKVVGRDLLIPVSGAGVRHPDDVWNRVLDWMDVPDSTSRKTMSGTTIGAEAGASGGLSMPWVAKGEVSGAVSAELTGEHGTEAARGHQGLQQVVREIANSDFVVLLDDFHYMPREVQDEVAKSLKEGVRLNVKVVTAAVSHRGDDVVRANPELRGRVRAIDLRYWSREELRAIAVAGFNVLNAECSPVAIDVFVDESAGSPQLMQQMCLQACFAAGVRERTLPGKTITLDWHGLQQVLEHTSATTDFRSLVDVLDAGPRTRGIERKTYTFMDDTKGDVYRTVLKAVAADPPKLSFPYDELLARTAEMCVGDSPVGSSVSVSCVHMSKLAQDKFPNERAIDWDEQKQVLDIPDPYLLFYLRWSGRLHEDNA